MVRCSSRCASSRRPRVSSSLRRALQLVLDALDRLLQRRARRDVVRVGVDLDECRGPAIFWPVSGSNSMIDLDLVAEQARCARRGPRSGRGRARSCRRARGTCRARNPWLVRLYCRATRSAMSWRWSTLSPTFMREGHRRVGLDRADAVDAGDRGDDDDVVALEQRARRRVAHAVDLLVDRGFLLDIGVGARDVGFRLVIVVVGDEVLDRVVGKEALELAVELRGERLVRREDQRRALRPLDHLRHGEGLAGAGDAEQHLVALLLADAFDELADGRAAGRPPARIPRPARSACRPRIFSGRGRAVRRPRHAPADVGIAALEEVAQRQRGCGRAGRLERAAAFAADGGRLRRLQPEIFGEPRVEPGHRAGIEARLRRLAEALRRRIGVAAVLLAQRRVKQSRKVLAERLDDGFGRLGLAARARRFGRLRRLRHRPNMGALFGGGKALANSSRSNRAGGRRRC